jgi:ADP-heptose:LPS heptosyltransferase
MEIKNRHLFRLTRLVLFKVSALFRFMAKFRSPQKRLLIIKTDAIGDYILFRNFLEVIKNSKTYSDYEIDLLGNQVYKDIALTYDAAFIKRFTFIKPYDLYESPLQTLKLGWQLFKRNYQLVLQPAYTRLLINDGLAALAAGKQIIGFAGDNEGIKGKYKSRTDKFYTQLLPLPFDIYFEFDRTKFFFETVLRQIIDLNAPHIPNNQTTKQGIVIFTGAGISKRGWKKEKFLELIKLIQTHTQQPIYLAGAASETETAQYLCTNLRPGSVNDLIGKTTLPQLVQLIASVNLVISNETSAVHIAAATQTPSVCILGGGHFGRFAPYPQQMDYKPTCVYNKMECFNCNWNCIFETLPNEPYPCIGILSVENVWAMVQQAIPQIQ